jgi:hypothetical protein
MKNLLGKILCFFGIHSPILDYSFNLAEDGFNMHKKVKLVCCDRKPYRCGWKTWEWDK